MDFPGVLWYCVWVRTPQYKRDTGMLRISEVLKGLDHLFWEDRLRKLGLFSLRRRCLGVISTMYINT